MVKLFLCICLLSGLVHPFAGYGQYTGDSLSKKNAVVPPVKKRSFARSLILPSVGLAYGAFALSQPALQDWNKTVQRNTVAAPGRSTNLDEYLPYVPAIASHVLSIAGVKGKHNLFDRLLIDGIAAVGSAGVVLLLKGTVSETRPDGSDDRSFPSNHAATAFCAAELLREEYRDVSPWYGIAGYSMAITTGYLRLYNNQHWFGDVVAGAAIGIASARIATKLLPLAKRILLGKKKSSLVAIPQ